MIFHAKNRGNGTCCWPIVDENGVERICGRTFTKFDPAQKVCDFHHEAYHREQARLKWTARQAKRKAST